MTIVTVTTTTTTKTTVVTAFVFAGFSAYPEKLSVIVTDWERDPQV